MKDYSEMLNLTFEIEGLLTLLQRRDDSEATNEIRDLLSRKVTALFDALGDKDGYDVPKDSDDCVERNMDPELAEIESMPTAGCDTKQDDVDVKSDIKAPAEELQTDPELSEIEAMPEVTEVDPKPLVETSESSDTFRYAAETATPHIRPLPVFTLNDKFRFRRELFANNEAEFNDTLNIISAMTSLAEAEDYLYNDLCWDASDVNVIDFMAVLTDYFK